MAAVYGYAEIETHIDGSNLPPEVAAAARRAATTGGQQFNKRFKKEMRAAGRAGALEFGKSLGNLIQTILLANGATRRLYQGTRILRAGFTRLGGTLKTFGLTLTSRVIRPFREFGDILRRDAIKTMTELREGAKFLRISFDDLKDTFPGITRAVTGLRNGFRYVGSEVRGFGTLLRNDSIKTMQTLRDGASKLRISLKDVEDTFPGLTRAARAAGRGLRVVGREIKDLGPDMDFLRPAALRVSDAFRSLTNRFRINRQALDAVNDGLKEHKGIADAAARTERNLVGAEDDLGNAHGRLTRRNNRLTGSTRSMLSGWKRLPHGFRQAVFWTGLVITALGTLSVITSALSGTIISLITIITAAGAAAGIAVAGFAHLFDEEAKLTGGALATRDAFKELGATFGTVQATIADNMFANMADSVKGLTDGLKTLEPVIGAFAGQVGEGIGAIFDALSSDAGIKNFTALFEGFGRLIQPISDIIIGFGGALANILIASLPTAQKFAEAIGDVGQQFLTWTASEEGQARLREFFETAERILPPIVDFVVAFGNALANLVTPTTIAGAEQFFQALTDFTPILGEIVEVIANLNVFGILAAALEAIGALLAPIVPVLAEFATILGNQLVAGLELLGPSFEKLGVALAPILEVIGILINALLPPLIDIIVAVVDTVTAWVDILAALLEPFLEDEEAVKSFGEVTETVFGIIGGIITFTTDIIMGVLKAVAALIRGDTAAAWKFLEQGVRDALAGVGLDFDTMVREFGNFVTDVKGMVDKVVTFFVDMGNAIGNAFSTAIGWINDVIGAIGRLDFGALGKLFGFGGGGGGFASGGLLLGPRRILAGEAGPEAIVPLRRNLSQVDPSVRALSAIAQGLSTPRMAGGGVVTSGGKSITVAEGAVKVEGVRDPYLASKLVVDRITELAVV